MISNLSTLVLRLSRCFRTIVLTLACLAVAGLSGCETDDIEAVFKEDPAHQADEKDDDPDSQIDVEKLTRFSVNMFAWKVMSTYYLWADEVKQQLDTWQTTDDPESKVAEVRYKNENGNNIDRWTVLLDDYDGFVSSVDGTDMTFGYDLVFGYLSSRSNALGAAVTYTSAGSPARHAGLQRGDIITQVNGMIMTPSNYATMADSLLSGSNTITLLVSGISGEQKTVIMTPVTMYEDPVLISKVFECPDKKIGYLCYNLFTLKSYERLMEVCRGFAEQGISELILDLRYNPGGYDITEQTLASMLAPAADVAAGSVYKTMIYNSILTEYYQLNAPDELSVPFKTDFSFTEGTTEVTYSTAGIHTGITRLYVLTYRTASASESIINSLKPYLDVVVIGSKTKGKYCGGPMWGAAAWYEANKDYLDAEIYRTGLEYAGNWGLYVMTSRYADKNGQTANMPDGLEPDLAVKDNVRDGYQLGDAGETMLAAALQAAGWQNDTSVKSSAAPASDFFQLLPEAMQPERAHLPGCIMDGWPMQKNGLVPESNRK